MRLRDSPFVEPFLFVVFIAFLVFTLSSLNRDFGLSFSFWAVAAIWIVPYSFAMRVDSKRRRPPLTRRQFGILMILLFSPFSTAILAIVIRQPAISLSGLIGGAIGSVAGMAYGWGKRFRSARP